jgi:ElaA protein
LIATTIMPTSPFTLEWQSKAFDRLTVIELYDVMRLRMAVFVVEQHCCYQDADGLDPSCVHLLGRLPSGQLACYLRIVPPGLRYAEPSIGRVVVDGDIRGSGIGRALMARGIELTDETYPTGDIRLSAQKYLERFYQSFGFITKGDDYLDDGIPHVEMYRAKGHLR